MDPFLLSGVMAILLLVLLAFGMHIAFALALVGVLGLYFLIGPEGALNNLAVLPFARSSIYEHTVIPLFIIMGALAFASGISEDVYKVGYKWFGHLPGGLAIATIFACAGFAAVTGSSVAEAAAMGKVAIPEMNKYGYDPKLSTGSVAAGGLLGILIPPSLAFVVYGILTQESIGKLFIAGIMPGILTTIAFMATVAVRVIRNPALAPRAGGVSWGERISSLPRVWGVIVIFLVVMGGIYIGVFTPTEAGAIGAFVALIMLGLAIARGRATSNAVLESLKSSIQTTAMIFALLIGGGLFSFFITIAGVPGSLAEVVVGLPVAPVVILLLFLAAYIPLGMFLDPTSILLVTMPITYPILVSTFGYSGIWLGVIVTKLIEISLLTPPVGLNVFVVKGVAPDVPLEDIFRGIGWFVVVEVLVLALLIAFPEISLWLPGKMK